MGNDTSKGGAPSSTTNKNKNSNTRSTNQTTGTSQLTSEEDQANGLGPPLDQIDVSSSTPPSHRSNSIHLDGHTPYHPHHATTSNDPPDTRTDFSSSGGDYSALDEGVGPVSVSNRSSMDLSSNDIISLNQRTSLTQDEMDAQLLHPEVEALLNLAQFYPTDPNTSTGIRNMATPPMNAKSITPSIIKPKAIMDVCSSLSHRWSQVGPYALRGQVIIGKEMDQLEHLIQQSIPHIQTRNMELRQLNAQLQQLPDLHASLQRQQFALAKCIQTMAELKSDANRPDMKRNSKG